MRILTVLLVCLLAALRARACSGDWPQILGPHRSGVADGERLNLDWPGGTPKTLWQRPVGDGVAGVAVAGDRAVLFHRVGNQELVEVMEAKTGKVVWKAGFPSRFRSDVGTAGDGPRCVPLIDRGHVYVFGAAGDLRCLRLEDGKELWSRATHTEFNAPAGYFGAGSTPIMEGDTLLVNVGGPNGAGIVAFDRQSGKTVWSVSDELASYSAPTAATIDGVRHVIFVTRLNVLSIDSRNGSVRFQFPFGRSGTTVNAATPLVIDGHVFVTASYGIGAVYARIARDGAQRVWARDEVMSSQYPTPVFKDGFLYGIDGRLDQGVAALRAIDPRSGKVAWSKEGFGMASLILADDKLVVMKTDGTLVVVAPDASAYRQLASARVLEGASARDPALALPALAGGLLYVRDTQTLKCLDLRK